MRESVGTPDACMTMTPAWPAASCSHELTLAVDLCRAPIDERGQVRPVMADPSTGLACLIEGHKPALLVAASQLTHLEDVMRRCRIETLRLDFRPVGAMHGMDEHADHVIAHNPGAAAWASRFRDTLRALWSPGEPDHIALTLGFRAESDVRLAALHFATGLFLGYRPDECAGYVDRVFRLGTYKHANGSFRLYSAPRRRALAEQAARIAAPMVAPDTRADGGEDGESCASSEEAERTSDELEEPERRSASAAARARLLGRLSAAMNPG